MKKGGQTKGKSRVGVKVRRPVAKKRKIAPKGKTPAVFVLTPRMLRLEEATFEPPKAGRGGKPFVPKGTILVPGAGVVEKDAALIAAARAYRRKHKAARLRTRPVRVKLLPSAPSHSAIRSRRCRLRRGAAHRTSASLRSRSGCRAKRRLSSA